jgi:hypothetical protein
VLDDDRNPVGNFRQSAVMDRYGYDWHYDPYLFLDVLRSVYNILTGESPDIEQALITSGKDRIALDQLRVDFPALH